MRSKKNSIFSKENLKIKLENFIIIFKIILKYFLYACICAGIVFVIYKLFNWKKIFDREYETAQIIQRKIDLPPVIKYAKDSDENPTTSLIKKMDYRQEVFLERLINKLKNRSIIITQIEETEIENDIKLLTSDGYRINISYTIDQELLFDNISSVYSSQELKQEIQKNGLSNLEYIDFRFKNKVYYKFNTAIVTPGRIELPLTD